MDEGKNPEADGDFYKALYLNFNDDKAKLDTNDVDNVNQNYASVYGFLPKPPYHKKEYPQRILFLLSGLDGTDPAAELAADFVYCFGECRILLGINGLYILHQAD